MSNNTQGILWALLAAVLFATAGAMAKIAVVEYHVLQILFFRQIVVFLSALPHIARSFPQNLKTQHGGIHLLRLIGAFVALSCSIWAVAILPLTTAITLAFAKVFLVVLLAIWFLKEKVGINRLAAISAGFVGVVIVMRPGMDFVGNLHSLVPILGALGAAVAAISVRKLSQTESTATLLVYQAVFVGALAGAPLFWLWVTPGLTGFIFLLAMAVVATVGQWVGVKALRLGEASIVGNIEYTNLIYAAIFGFFLFGEVPDVYTITGAVIIVGSSMYIYHREAFLDRGLD
ncbi:MAG: DMT family transporter [Rhodobacteraceae bacterium]|nr:DMT family transporter [Paracoccaceae bacterium]